MKNLKILALDPSGNFDEGKGTTGWCIFDVAKNTIIETSTISAKDYDSPESYWQQHIAVIDAFLHNNPKGYIVMEDYLLYESKAGCQVNSRFETPQLIGVIKHHCYMRNYVLKLQRAVDVKNRWSNPILVHKGYIREHGRGYIAPAAKIKINRHQLDSIRHAVHFATFGLKRGVTHE